MSDDAHSTKPFTNVLWALAGLTALTVGLSRVSLGSKGMNLTVGLIVAVLKAALVVLVFMHLKHEKRSWLGMVIFPLILVMIIIFSNLPDTGLNGKDSGGELLTPAEKVIPHAGRAGGGKH
jgi:cytochrome c oxidase subunit 4